MHLFARVVFYIISTIIILSATSGIVGYLAFQGSLPALQGEKSFSQIESDVKISRDEYGVPTIESESRTDTAFALGYLHAQERFFQMDTMRRYAAGELSELFGVSTIEKDRTTRIFRFREQAKLALMELTKAELLILEQYTLGVNQGLADLFVRPFEYLILLNSPVAWQKEDSLLIQYALFLYSQDATASQERSRELLKTNLPEEWYNFLLPRGGVWDRPISGESVKIQSPIPKTQWPVILSSNLPATTPKPLMLTERSNVIAISKKGNPAGRALLSNNIDIPLTTPNLWYRAEWLSDSNWIRGLTIPGMPQMNIGSNGKIAWGLASSRGDWIDRIILETNPSGTLYLTPEGWENFSIYKESIRISRSEALPLEVRVTKWGPVIGTDSSGNLIAVKWSVFEKNAANFQLLNLEHAINVDQALTVASYSGMAQQDFLVTDSQGNIGWTIMGVIPERIGFNGKLPENWSSRKKYWKGTLDQGQYPSVRRNESKLIVTNNRLVSGLDLLKIGHGRYELGERSDELITKINNMPLVNEQALMKSHSGHINSIYNQWKQLLVNVLEDASDVDKIFKQLISITDSEDELQFIKVVSIFRNNIINNTTGQYFDDFDAAYSDFEKQSINQMIEYTTWQLLNERPEHLLPKQWSSWESLILETAKTSIEEFSNMNNKKTHLEPIKHSMSGRLPGLNSLFNYILVDGHQIFSAGNNQVDNLASSANLAVSPGNETEGLISLPQSQSGHPLSPYYRASHQLWVENKYSSFIAGDKKWQLQFFSQQ